MLIIGIHMWCIKRWHCRWAWMTFEGHFSCRNHLSTNTSVTYYAPERCWPSSVCLSVPCLDLSRELKGPGSPYLAPWKPMTREHVSKSKGQGHRADYSWHTKCSVSSEREGLRTLNLVDGGRSLDLRKSPRPLCDSWASCFYYLDDYNRLTSR